MLEAFIRRYAQMTSPQQLRSCEDNLFYVDIIRALAISMVVLLHTAAVPMKHFSTISPSEWWISNLVFSFSHQSVPLFIMISGLLLLNTSKNETIGVFYRKRIKKVIIPFIFWGIIYYCWRIFFKSESHTFQETLKIFLKGPIYYHLWFIYMIIGLYLATPILRVYLKTASRLNLLYFITLWFLITSLLPIFSSITGMTVGIRVGIFTGTIGYFLLGPLIAEINLSKKYLWMMVIVVAGTTLFTAIGTHYITLMKGGHYNGIFVTITRPNIVIMSVCMFFILSNIQYARLFSKSEQALNIFRKIAATSLGIYFLHPIVLEILETDWLGFELNAMSMHPAIGIPITMLATMTISYMLVTMLKRVPLVNRVVP